MTTGDETTLQASAVAIEGSAVLIEGAPGTGKSTLALGLIDRGATLVGDDGVRLQKQGSILVAAPPPNIAGKLEIRGVGIVELPTCSAPLALVISLDKAGARLPERADIRTLLGQDFPSLSMGGSDAGSLPLRVEWALRIHGLIAGPAEDWV